MGCDIHTRVEYKDYKGNWVCGDYFRMNTDYHPDSESWFEREPYVVVGLCDSRNYELFATLANVRNYDYIPYIDEPRGIPKDACESTRKEYEAWECDAHSASWFTLRELIDWNNEATGKVKRSGYMSVEAANMLDTFGEEPRFWCGYTSNPDWVYREWEVEYRPLDHLIDALKQRGDELYLWYNDKQCEERAENMRFVFWFDN